MKMWIGTAIVLLSAGPTAAQNWNLLNNPNFDTDLDHWTPVSDAVLFFDANNDVHGDPDSGSMVIIQIQDDVDVAAAVADCVPIESETEYTFGGRFHVTAAQPGDPGILIGLTMFDGPDCTGTILMNPGTNNHVLIDQWFLKSGTRFTPPGALSADFHVLIFNGSTDLYQVHSDTMFVIDITPVFNDGFESSDTGAWSLTMP